MKKSILFLVCALLGVGGSLVSTTDVNAESVSKGNFAQVSSEEAPVYDQNGNATDVALQKDST
ncbi:hypothetical protein [Companilactobacillus farciminis]|nr:hypothetical protein [Companilactobacillus farciminis]